MSAGEAAEFAGLLVGALLGLFIAVGAAASLVEDSSVGDWLDRVLDLARIACGAFMAIFCIAVAVGLL